MCARIGVPLLVLALLAPAAAGVHFPANAAVVLLGGATDAARDADGDGRPDELRLEVPIQVRTAGAYEVRVLVRTEPGGAGVGYGVNTTFAAGDHRVALRVPGSKVWNDARDGTYLVNATVRAAATGALVDWKDYQTSSYASSAFEPARVSLPVAPVLAPVDEDGDWRAERFRLDVPYVARDAGNYSLEITLVEESGGAVIDVPKLRTVNLPVGAGVHEIMLAPGSMRAGYEGAYRASVRVLEPDTTAELARTSSRSDPIRVGAFSGAPRITAIALDGPAVAGAVRATGIGIDVTVASSGLQDVEVTLQDPRSGESVTVSSGLLRREAGQTIGVRFAAEDAARVLAVADVPFLYVWLKDEFAFAVAGARFPLLAGPRAAITITPPLPLPGEVVTLSGVAPGGPPASALAWEWDVGAGFAAGGPTRTAAFPDAKPYSVRVRATNAYGYVHEASKSFAVELDKPPVVHVHPWRVTEAKNSTYTVNASDPNGRDLRILVLRAPEGVAVNGSMSLDWTPPFDAAPTVIEVNVTDGSSSNHVGIPVEVTRGNAPPVLHEVGKGRVARVYEVAPGAPFHLAVEAFDREGNATVLANVARPAAATYDEGVIDWPAVEEGEHAFAFSMTQGETVHEASFVVRTPPPPPPSPPPVESPPTEAPPPPPPEATPPREEGIPSPGLVAIALVALAVAALRRRH